MKYTMRATSAEVTSPLAVSTEDPSEALESVRSFGQAQMSALVVDENDKPVELADLRQAVELKARLGDGLQKN